MYCITLNCQKWNKTVNQIIWSYIEWIITILQISITPIKVKTHSDIELNDLTDRLAKDECNLKYNILQINSSFINTIPLVKWSTS